MSEMNEEILKEAAEACEAENTDQTADAADTQSETEENAAEDAQADEDGEDAEAAAQADDEAGQESGPEEDEEAEESGASEEKPGDKKSFFKKKKDKKDEQIEELNDKLKRQMAEFDNFRKRTEKEKAQMYDMGARSIIEKVLPVIDNFERGLAAVPEEAKEDAFVVGMDKVYKQMLSELEAIGVKAIDAVGQEFDPEFHNAVMQTESEEYESGVVAQELQKGYMYKDSVVRHSMVAVVS